MNTIFLLPPHSLVSDSEMAEVRKDIVNAIHEICKFLNFRSDALEAVFDPINRANNLDEMKAALKVSKRAFAVALKELYTIERDIVALNAKFVDIKKPEGWGDLLNLSILLVELDRIEQVRTQDDIEKAFALGRLLRGCVYQGNFQEIYHIADSHAPTPHARSWLFYYVINQISIRDVLQAHPLWIDQAQEFYGQITHPIFQISAEGVIAECFFELDQMDLGFGWINRMNDPDFKMSSLNMSLNNFFRDPFAHGKCLRIAAALCDVKKRRPLGTSTIEEGLKEITDKELKFGLVKFHNATKPLKK